MALSQSHSYRKLSYQALPAIKNHHPDAIQHPPPQRASDSTLPIFTIVILSIITTVFLLISYFTFISKCCSNGHRLNPLRWIFVLRSPRRREDPFIALSPTAWNRGLHESLIREIPTFQFRRGIEDHQSVYGCVVCLTEFQEQDVLKVLPNCSHAFHSDCIDIWLQTNSNCPLCRSSITGNNPQCPNPMDHIIAPSSSPQDSQLQSNIGSEEDYVVIELSPADGGISSSLQRQQVRSQFARKMEQNKVWGFKPRKCHHVSIMGDEGIDVRKKDDQFCIQPIRRSFSMDSATDRQVYFDVQAIIQQNRHPNEGSASEEYSNSRGRRLFFPFRYGRGSKNAVLPLENEV